MTPFERKIQRAEWHLYMNPYKKDTVSVTELFICMALIPIVGCISGFFTAKRRLHKKKLKVSVKKRHISEEGFNSRFNLCDPHSFIWCDAVDMLLAFTLAVEIVMTFGNYAKYWVGRPRPDYFDRCFNDITKDTDPDSQEYLNNRLVNINDLDQTNTVLKQFYTAEKTNNQVKPFKCYNADHESRRKILVEGLKSFPSGHSLSAGVVFWFCSLYVWGKLQAFAPSKRFQSWRFVVGTIPLVPLLYTIITRTSDYRHHWQDVCVGALFGIIGAWVCYRLYYPELSSVYCHYSYRQQYWLLDYDESNLVDRDDPEAAQELKAMQMNFENLRGGSFKMHGSQKPTNIPRNNLNTHNEQEV
jgi:membrane-associated phospholipid phosphatase